MMSCAKPILLVEDRRSQGTTVRQALEVLEVGGRVVHCSTAAEALQYLNDGTTHRPSVVLADASRRDADGLEILRRVKADERFATIPVIIVASSSDVRTIDESFGLGVAGYVVRSPELGEFVEAMRAVHEYWMLSESPAGR